MSSKCDRLSVKIERCSVKRAIALNAEVSGLNACSLFQKLCSSKCSHPSRCSLLSIN